MGSRIRKPRSKRRGRAEAEQRRAAARDEREQAENVRQTAESVAETMATTVAFPVHLARRTAETTRENVRSSLDTAAQGFQSLTDQFKRLTGLAEAEELARRSFANLQAVSDSSTVLARGIQEASQLWLALAQERLTKNVEGFSRLTRCRSPIRVTVPLLPLPEPGLLGRATPVEDLSAN
jgi:hypothetical protein